MAPQVPRGLKPLAVMLGEYVALREADERRAHLFAKNPALRDMFQIIETQSAALQPTYAGQVRVRPANLTHAIKAGEAMCRAACHGACNSPQRSTQEGKGCHHG